LALTGLSSKLSVSEGLLAQSTPVCERWEKTDLFLWLLNQSLQKQMFQIKMCLFMTGNCIECISQTELEK